MLKGNWLRYVALGGCLAAGITYAQPVSNDAGREHGATQEKAEPPNQPQPSPSFSENIRRIAEAIEAINGRQDSPEETNRATRDLNAQEDMAYWAELMFGIAFAQLIIGGVTLWFLFQTFRETRRTANAAIEAAEAARATASEAQRATNTAEESAFLDQRPWVSIQNLAIERIVVRDGPPTGNPEDAHYTHTLRIIGVYELTNSGKAPAQHLSVSCKAASRYINADDHNEFIEFAKREVKKGFGVVVAPSSSMKLRIDRVVGVQYPPPPELGYMPLYLSIIAVYSSTIGRQICETVCGFSIHKARIEPGPHLGLYQTLDVPSLINGTAEIIVLPDGFSRMR